MRVSLNKTLLAVVAILLLAVIALRYRVGLLAKERDRYRENTTALLSEMKRIQIDSTTMAVDVKTLRLTVDEFEQYRAQNAALFKRMGLRIKDLEAAARHTLSIDAPIDAPMRDTVIVRDTVRVLAQTVEMKTPHIQLHGVIENNRLTGNVHLPVTLNQAVWVEYKHKFLWWRWKVKNVHQTISSDNPYVEIEYSEYIRIEK